MSRTHQYIRPSWIERTLVNRIVRVVVGGFGRAPDGIHMLVAHGRHSGKRRETPVKVLHVDGDRFLVSRHGQSHWTRNLEANPEAELRVGRRRERVYAVRLPDGQAARVLREYVRQASLRSTLDLFGVASADASEDEYLRSAATHPVFRLDAR